MPDGTVRSLPRSRLDRDHAARLVASRLAPDATCLDALAAFGLEVHLVPRRLTARDGATLELVPDAGELFAFVGVLPQSPASMRALEAHVRWALAFVVVGELLEDWQPRSSEVHAIAHEVAARVLELRGPLLPTHDGERARWAALVPSALEVAHELAHAAAARRAA